MASGPVTALPNQKADQARLSSVMDSAEFKEIAGGICHRVKNDFQTVANLIAMAAQWSSSPQQLCTAMDGRIAALSTSYTAVSSRGAPPLFDHLAREIGDLVSRHQGVKAQINYDLPPLKLNLRLCSPLALWLFETISNAVRHGVPSQGHRIIEVHGGLDDDNFWLSVGDNGPGLSPEIDLEDRESLGMGLVLAQGVATCDLRGQLTLEGNSPGLKINLLTSVKEFHGINQGPWR